MMREIVDRDVNIICEEGLTVRVLKEFLANCPDTDVFGEENDVMIGGSNNISCPAVSVFKARDGIMIGINPPLPTKN